MSDLFVASDLARRLIDNSLQLDTDSAARPAKSAAKKRMRRRRGLRSVSAAALRGLAERLEPSPSA